MEQKTNYRNVYKSDHLGVVDLEEVLERGEKLIFTIKEVRQEIGATVAGKKGNFNIAYFNEQIKPWVLNSTNATVIKRFSGGSSFVENWKNIKIELYIDPNVKMKGDIVGGVRIKPQQPTDSKPIFTVAHFDKAKKANASIEMIKSKYELTAEIEAQYNNYGTEN